MRIRSAIAAATLFIFPQITFAQATPTPPLTSAATKPGDWLRAETPHFILYSDGKEKELREDAIKLERFDTLMRGVTRIGDDKGQVKLSVYFVRSPEKVRALHGGKSANVAGFYRTSPAGAVAVVPRSIDAFTGDNAKFAEIEDVILFHEYAHHLMLQYFTAAYPAWYVEGFAEFIGNSRVESNGMASYGIPNISRAPTLFSGSRLSIDRLLTLSTADVRSSDADLYYGRAWLLTHFLHFDKTRSGQLTKYLNSLQTGKPSLIAAQEAFGDLKQLHKELDRYLNGKMRYTSLAAPIPAPTQLAVTRLDEGASAAVLLQMRLSRGTLPDEREPLAAELRKLAALYPGSREVLTALAEAELDLKNFAAAGVAADKALALDPTNSRTMLWKGLSLSRQMADAGETDAAKWKSARSWIAKANRANPEDPLPLMEYYLSFGQAAQATPQLAVDGLAKAAGLVPQDSGMRWMYSGALADQKKFDNAITVLRPIANNPHGGSMSETVRKRIESLEKAKNGKALPREDLAAPN
jgi:tetratricopeptide (TPR) repeat protein